MPTIAFTPNLQRHLDCPEITVAADTVADALEQGRLRQHVAVFVGGELIRDRVRLSDTVAASQDIFVMQALSGG